MANDAVRTAHIKDTTDLYADIASGELPAVSFVKPSGWVDGHPASSKWNLYEGFVKKIRGRGAIETKNCGRARRSSSLRMRAVATTTPDTCSRWTFFGDGTRIP